MTKGFIRRASFGLNIALAVAVLALAVHRWMGSSAPASISTTTAKPPEQASPGNASSRQSAADLPHAAIRYEDSRSAAERRRLVVEQLRALGVPNDMLALVARVDFEMEWESRFAECHADMDKLAAMQLEMNMGKDDAMRAALGDAGFRQWDQKCMLWETMSSPVEVTTAEAGTIYGMKKRLQQRLLEVEQARLKGTMDDATINATYDRAYAEFYGQLKGVLGEDRYAKSQQLDDDFLAGNLRHELAKANTTDSQFQELFRAEQIWKRSRSELDQQFQNAPWSQEYKQKLKALDEAHEQEYVRVLGSETVNTLRKEQDPGFITMKKFQALWGLDDGKVDYVYSTMNQYAKDVEGYKAQVRALQAQGQNPDWEAVNRDLKLMADQTQQTLLKQIGEASLSRLQRNRILRFTMAQPSQ